MTPGDVLHAGDWCPMNLLVRLSGFPGVLHLALVAPLAIVLGLLVLLFRSIRWALLALAPVL